MHVWKEMIKNGYNSKVQRQLLSMLLTFGIILEATS